LFCAAQADSINCGLAGANQPEKHTSWQREKGSDMLTLSKRTAEAVAILTLFGFVAQVRAYTDTCAVGRFTYATGRVDKFLQPPQKVNDSIFRMDGMPDEWRGWAVFDLSSLRDSAKNYSGVYLHYCEYRTSGTCDAKLRYCPYANPTQNTIDALYDSLGTGTLLATEPISDSLWHTVDLCEIAGSPGQWPDVHDGTMVISWITVHSGSTNGWAWDYGWDPQPPPPTNLSPFLEFVH
jgi:hypothetical protein